MPVNITNYFSQGDVHSSFYSGRMTLKDDYGILNADEAVYNYLQNSSSLPFTALVHAEDADYVREALGKAEREPQYAIFRMQDGEENYRYMYGSFVRNRRKEDNAGYIDVELMDIIQMRVKFDDDRGRILKYRKLMSLSDKLYFEYRYEDGYVALYEYFNGRSDDHYKGSLNQLRKEIAARTDLTFKQRAEFETLQEYLSNHTENVVMEIDSRIFGLERGYLQLKGGVTYRNNQCDMFVATLTVTGETKHTEKYYESAYAYDSATGLYNKRAIAEAAQDLIARQAEMPVFLCILDVDDFKLINDNFGHMAGDDIIAKVAEILRTTVGDRGYVGRFGGDEFLIVTDGVKDADEFVMMLKAIRKNIMWECSLLYEGASVTTSVGIAQYPKDVPDYEELFKIADKCLYLAKAKGKNRFVLYIPEVHKDMFTGEVTQKTPAVKRLNVYAAQCREAADIFNFQGENTKENLDSNLQHLLENYDMDRIAIYGGDHYDLLYAVGDTEGLMTDVAFVEEPQCVELFDTNGIYSKNQILPLREKRPDLYEKLQKQGTEGYLLVKMVRPDGFKMLIAYDIMGRQRKWSSNEEGLLYIIAQFIASRYRSLEK